MSKFLTSTCCFIGHDDIPRCDEEKIITRVRYILDHLLNRGIQYYGVGGNAGFDIITAEFLIELRDRYGKKIKIISVLPFPEWNNDWDSSKLLRKKRILQRSDKVTYVQAERSKDAYMAVNRKLIDESAYCVSYCNRQAGETADAVRYALQKGLDVFNASSWPLGQLQK